VSTFLRYPWTVTLSLCGFGLLLRWLLMVARAGSGYKAKVAASALFVSELDLDVNAAPEVADEAYLPLRLFRARRVDGANAVEASLFGLGRRRAVWRPNAGTALSSGQPAPLTVPGPAAPTPALKAAPNPALDAVLDAAFTEPDPKKLRRTRAIVIVRDGVVVGERYAPGITDHTPLPGWSMTKSVLGVLTGIAVGRGLLKPGQKKLLPEWDNDSRSGIALEDLLRMRSGLRFAEKYANPASDVVQMLFALDDAAGYAASRPIEHPPGTHWQYASGTTNIISLLLRRALGDAAYHAFPRKALFDPAGMESAVFETDSSGTFVGSSFLFATARDWARFGLFCLNEGAGIPEGWMKFSTTPTPQAPDGLYGAQWWLKLTEALGGKTPAAAKIPADAYHALGHEAQCLTIIPSKKLVVLRLGLSIQVDAWDHAAFLAEVLAALPN
jgi:hypothetical protein